MNKKKGINIIGFILLSVLIMVAINILVVSKFNPSDIETKIEIVVVYDVKYTGLHSNTIVLHINSSISEYMQFYSQDLELQFIKSGNTLRLTWGYSNMIDGQPNWKIRLIEII